MLLSSSIHYPKSGVRHFKQKGPIASIPTHFSINLIPKHLHNIQNTFLRVSRHDTHNVYPNMARFQQ